MLFAIFIALTWKYFGYHLLLYLAGLQNIPAELLEAAEIDGATSWQRFWSVSLPILSPVLFFNLVIGVIGSFQVFTNAFVMTNGGPNNATLFMLLYLYRNAFMYSRMGFASALAYTLYPRSFFGSWTTAGVPSKLAVQGSVT